MNICVITSSFPANKHDARAAAGLFVKDFCVALTELGHTVTVVTPDKIPAEKEDIAGLDVHWFPWLGGKKTLSSLKPYYPQDALAMLSLFREGRKTLDALVAENNFDHVMAMWGVPAGYLAMGLKKRYGIPYTTWCLGSDIWTYGKYPVLKNVVAKVLRSSDYLFADGIQLAQDATKLSGCACPFMPTSRSLDQSLGHPVNVDKNTFNFLFVGRYAPVKGVDVLLDAMAKFNAEGSKKGHLYVFGGGPLEEEILQRVEQPDLKECVSVGGFADEPTYISYLQACDCVIIPSRMESIPVVLSDALQLGKPIIVSDVGDMGELLRETPAGIVVPKADSYALAEALSTMAQEPLDAYTPHIAALAGKFDLSHTAHTWISTLQATTSKGDYNEK